jgi:transcriptional regulator with XRE-family HTH domain
MTAEEIKTARATLGLTQAGLAERTGLSIDTIRAYEQGARPVSNIAATFINAIVKQEGKSAKEFVHFHQLDSKETEIRTDESVTDILEEGNDDTV